MNDITIVNGETVSVSVNGEKLPLVESVTEESRRTVQSVYSFGESEAREQVFGQSEYFIRLVKLPGGTALPASFTLTLSDSTKSVSYYGCRCKRQEIVTKAGEPIKEIIDLEAARREENA